MTVSALENRSTASRPAVRNLPRPLFRRDNPNGWGEPNPPCDGHEARQHVGCDRLYFSAGWLKRRTWLARYNPEARAEWRETSPEYEAAWVRNRSIECEDCMAEEFRLHPGEARAIINRMHANGGKTTFRGVPIELVDLRKVRRQRQGARRPSDWLNVPLDTLVVDGEADRARSEVGR